jgi:hypothetical protein
MNYHTAIEQLCNELHANRNIYTPDQLKQGHLQLIQLTNAYLASEQA